MKEDIRYECKLSSDFTHIEKQDFINLFNKIFHMDYGLDWFNWKYIDNIYGDLKQNKMPIIPKNRNNKLNTNCNYEQTLYGKSLIRNYEEFLLDKQHYNLVNYEIKRAFIFNAVQGEIFKDYVDYFFKMMTFFS